MNEEALTKVAFLDTNTLHYIRLYLNHAEEHDLYPYGRDDDIEKSRACLKQMLDGNLKKSLRQGMETIYWILTQGQIKYVEYAAVSELELLSGIVRGKALLNAATEGPPHRMWNRIYEEEIRDWLSGTDLLESLSVVDGLSSLLENSEIAVRSDHKERTRDVIELAKDILSLVYMEPIDCIVYASALVSRADYLFTSDGYVRDTVNKIRKRECEKYTEINRQLKERVRRFTLEPPDSVVLASAHQLTADGNILPDPF